MPIESTPTTESPTPSRTFWHGVRGPESNPSAQVGASIAAGKKLYMTALLFNAQNDHMSDKGQIKIRDGSITGTVKFAFTLPSKATGTNAMLAMAALSFPTPVVFNGAPFIVHDLGTLTVTIAITGYEE